MLPDATYTPSGPWVLRVLLASKYTLDTPFTPDTPMTLPNGPLYPLGTSNAPDAPYTPSGPSVPRVIASSKWSLLKLTPQVSYIQFYGELELKFTPSKLSSNFQMTFADQLPDIPPHNWNCQWQQVNYWLINVWSENPFKTVIFVTALHCVQLYMLSFGVELLDR